MTIQFKKFLLLLVSVILGVLVFALLVKITKTGDNFNAGPALGMLYGPISLVSMFIFYRLLKKEFF